MLITITGLPRSGTAFLATFLSMNPDYVVFHELAAYDKDWRETLKSYPNVINVNTYAYLENGHIPSDKYMLVDNSNIIEMKHSLQRINIWWKEEALKKMRETAMKWMYGITQNPEIEFCFSSKGFVFELNQLKLIWNFCFDVPSPADIKIEQMLKLRVTHKEEVLMYNFQNKIGDSLTGN